MRDTGKGKGHWGNGVENPIKQKNNQPTFTLQEKITTSNKMWGKRRKVSWGESHTRAWEKRNKEVCLEIGMN